VERVLSSWIGAAEIQDAKRGNTPLHLQCMNSQRSAHEVSCFVRMCPQAASILNLEGQSPLHVACISNAMLPVLKLLVSADPSMILQRDRSGTTPAALHWKAYSSSIHGIAALDAALRGVGSDIPGHFERFWSKMAFLLGKGYAYQHNTLNNSLIIHAIIAAEDIPPDSNVLSLALKLCPDWALQKDSSGNSPLHVAAEIAPPKVIRAMVTADKNAAKMSNDFGQMPLFLAIKSGRTWSSGIEDIVRAAPDILGKRDPESSLYPYQFAASVCSEESAANTVFELLLARPELVCA